VEDIVDFLGLKLGIFSVFFLQRRNAQVTFVEKPQLKIVFKLLISNSYILPQNISLKKSARFFTVKFENIR